MGAEERDVIRYIRAGMLLFIFPIQADAACYTSNITYIRKNGIGNTRVKAATVMPSVVDYWMCDVRAYEMEHLHFCV